MDEPIQSGNFEDFFRAHYQKLAQAIFLVTGSTARAEELAQEAMLRVYERWDRVLKMASPDGYLFRVGLNLGKREASRRSEYPVPDGADLESIATRQGQVEPGPQGDTRLDTISAMASLTPEQREVATLVLWLDLTAKRAADILGIAEATVRTRLLRARRTLRTHLEIDDE